MHVNDGINIARLIGSKRYKNELMPEILRERFDDKFWNKLLSKMGNIDPNSSDGNKAFNLYLEHLNDLGSEYHDRAAEKSAIIFANKLTCQFSQQLRKTRH